MNNTMRTTMNRMMKHLVIVLAFFTIAPPATLLAKPGGGPGTYRGTDPAMMSGLNLTDKQIDLLKDKRIAQRKTMIGLRSQMETLRTDLAEEASTNRPDMRRIDRISSQIGDVHGRMTAERTKGIVYLRSLLSDEQRKQLDARRLIFGMSERSTRGPRR
ncbi:Spy/CpxP family protein refolding chaperone [Prosthecochloris sp. GSB1]|uniref:Spy/CpxP family protein refolding chaperone n=1 Tax=Prosthecochloris sp. GSB1 TaxID=281093 RepID=UPI001C2BE12D|nr:periplasmic heavy metal sensor [Prosthecochloris sp. GSB1]